MYVDEAGGHRIGTTVGQVLATFAATANEGGFAVDERGGDALLRAVRGMADWLDGNLGDLAVLGEEPPLGTSVGAAAVRGHVAAAGADEQGLLTRLRGLRATLDEVERGVLAAMSNYAATDGLTAGDLNTVGPR